MNKIFKKRVQRDLKNSIESGLLNPQQFLAAVNEASKDLLLLNDDDFNKKITDYWGTQEKLEDDIEAATKKIMENGEQLYNYIIKEF